MSTSTLARMATLSNHLYLDGSFVASAGARHPVNDPASAAVVGHYADATPNEVERAIASAKTAQQAWWA